MRPKRILECSVPYALICAATVALLVFLSGVARMTIKAVPGASPLRWLIVKLERSAAHRFAGQLNAFASHYQFDGAPFPAEWNDRTVSVRRVRGDISVDVTRWEVEASKIDPHAGAVNITYSIGIYSRDTAHPPSKSEVSSLMEELKSGLSTVPTLRIVKDQ